MSGGALAAVVVALSLSLGGAADAPAAPPALAEGAGRSGSVAAHDGHRHGETAPTGLAARPPGRATGSGPGTPSREPEIPPTEAAMLVERTADDLARWADVAVAEAAGYRSIGDAASGYEHLVHPLYTLDPHTLDPARPESLVYRVRDGHRELVSAMYILPPGRTMEDVPDLGDPRAVWHIHDDLCFADDGRVAGRHVDGRCVPGGTRVVTPPMLHVWVVEHPCGPFAGLDGHGGECHRAH